MLNDRCFDICVVNGAFKANPQREILSSLRKRENKDKACGQILRNRHKCVYKRNALSKIYLLFLIFT